jgi:hypothetical protein
MPAYSKVIVVVKKVIISVSSAGIRTYADKNTGT